jgi:hypothetical protein
MRRQIISADKYAQLVANKAEMLAYSIIATSGNIDGEQEIRSTKFDEFSSSQLALIGESINIRAVVQSSNTAKFFKILKNPKLNYFFSCILIIFLKSKWEQAIT